MDFFLDTADLKEIKELSDLKIISGITTNPSLMSKLGIKGKENWNNHYKKICSLIDGPVSAEVISTSYDEIIDEGLELSKLNKNIVVKVPMINDGIKAISFFSKNKIKTNCTLVFSPIQALIAAKAGATYVSPFIGRLDDIGENGLDLIESIRIIFDNYNMKTKILGASIRSNTHIEHCAEIGADVITAPYQTLKKIIYHKLTDSGLKKFLDDYNKTMA